MYSIVLLKESTVVERKNTDDTKFFEESIILLDVDEAFFEENSPTALLTYFNEKIPSEKYINGYGEIVHNRVVRVIAYFPIIDVIEATDFTEVYSRFFVESTDTTVEEVVNKYYQQQIE